MLLVLGSDVVVGEEAGAIAPPPLKFSRSENFLLEKFSSQSTKFEPGNLGAELKFCATGNLLYRKFATVCRKNATFSPTF